MSAWYDKHYDDLDAFLKPYEWNFNLPRFFDGFFGQDRTWVAGALKAVLPAGRLTDEEISEAAYSLSFYDQHSTLDLDKARHGIIIAEKSLQDMERTKHDDPEIPTDEEEGYIRQMMAEENERQEEAEKAAKEHTD
jgi:hypothetical protein